MYRRILFGMDSQGQAAPAIGVVTILAKASGAEVVVLHVRDAGLDLESPAVARGHVQAAVRRLTDAGVRARGEVVRTADAEPAWQIANEARAVGADLVALGSRGRTRVGGLLLGSVSHEVAARLDVPILLVHAPDVGHGPELPRPIRRVLVAVDDSERTEPTLAAARELAGEHGAAVLAVHAREVGFFGGTAVYVEGDASAAALLERAATRLDGSGRLVETRTLTGDGTTAARIAEAAERWDADVVVVGSRRLTDLGGLLLGSVAHDLVRRTNRPVMLAERVHSHAR
jgi:nucleotide-binding universal stress UspA family protein